MLNRNLRRNLSDLVLVVNATDAAKTVVKTALAARDFFKRKLKKQSPNLSVVRDIDEER